MRYILVWADYMSTGLRDEFSGSLAPEDIGVGQSLCSQLSDWVAKYERITPLSELERVQRMDEINVLDEEGIMLARAIQTALGEEGKVSYFSEGLLRKLPV